MLYGKLLQFLPAAFFLLATPLVAMMGGSRKAARYWVPLITLLLSYEALAGSVGSFAAMKGAVSLYQLDKLIWGFNLTGWIQTTFFSPPVTDVADFLYDLHMPLIVVGSSIIWSLKRPVFGKYVTALTVTSYAALLTFIILPTSPPWFDGVTSNLLQSNSSLATNIFASLTSMIESDKFAAFPSLHAAYAIIFAYFMLKLRRQLGLMAIPLATGILFSTLYLGQHYLIDLIGGAAYALVPCAVSERFQLYNVK